MRCKGILLLVFMAALTVKGADVKFSARVHATRIGLDDRLILTLTLDGINALTEPEMSALDDFSIEGHSRGTEIRLVNGDASHLTRFEYILVPKRVGTLTVPEISYSHAGHILKTAPITVEVVAGSIAPPPRRRSIFQDDLFSSPMARARKPVPVEIRVETRLSQRSVVTGQQILLEILLLTGNRDAVEAVNLPSKPSMPGFWPEWFPVPRDSEGNEVKLDGKTYTAFSIRRVALFPLHSGTLTIPTLRFEVVLADEGFGFFSSTRRISRSTPPIAVEVVDPPADAVGLPVGEYSFSLDPVPSNLGIDDMLGLKLRIRGDGNMKTLVIPVMGSGPFHQVFPPRIQREMDYSGDLLRGTVTAEIPVSFRKGGNISLPTLAFHWYSPREKKVKSVEAPMVTVQVIGEKTNPAIQSPAASAEAVRRGEDIRHIRSGKLIDQSRFLHGTRLFSWLLIFPFAVSLFLFLWRIIWDPWIRRNQRFQSRRVLSATLRSLNTLNGLSGAAPILEAYLRQRAGLPPSRMNSASISATLEKYGVPESEIRLFMELKERADSLRFSPGNADEAGRNDILKLRKLIRSIDKRIS